MIAYSTPVVKVQWKTKIILTFREFEQLELGEH